MNSSHSKLAMPAIIAMLAGVIVFRAIGMGWPLPDEPQAGERPATPYSADHALIQERTGDRDSQPATF